MAVALADYVEALKAKVNPPGVDLYPDATDAQWETRLSNAFWQAILEGTLSGYTEALGSVDPDPIGGSDISRSEIQLIIIYGAIDSVRMYSLNQNTGFRAHAGPVEYETKKSATLLNSVLDSLLLEKARLLEQIAPIYTTGSYYYSALENRDYYGQFDSFLGDYS